MLKKISLIIGGALLIISILLTISLPIRSKINIIKEEKISNKYISMTSINTDEKESNDDIDYIAILEIPDINLMKPLTKDSVFNDIKYNVQIISGDIPTEDGDNLVLAAHSGNSEISFFKDLYKLNLGANIIIYHNGYKYIYKLSDYYELEKTGRVRIIRDRTMKTLTLTTCSNGNKQAVYIAYFYDKKSY